MSRVFGERGGETRENFGAGLKYESRLNDGSIYIYLFSMVCGWSVFVWADCTLDLVCTVGLNMEVTRIESAGIEVKVINLIGQMGTVKMLDLGHIVNIVDIEVVEAARVVNE